MSRYNTDVAPSISTIIANLDRRLRAIESGNRIGFTSVDSGSFSVSASLSLNLAGDHVDASDGISDANYDDLASFGPAVGTTISSSGMALVVVSCLITLSVLTSDTNLGWMSFLASGPTSLLPDDLRAAGITITQPASSQTFTTSIGVSKSYVVTALSPGSYTFTAKYRGGTGSSGTVAFAGRSLSVLPF